MINNYVFVTVSLIDNLKQVTLSVKKFYKLYDIYKYIIITPKESVLAFKNAFHNIDFVEVVDENKILNKQKFDNICNEFLKVKTNHQLFRKNW